MRDQCEGCHADSQGSDDDDMIREEEYPRGERGRGELDRLMKMS